MKRDWVTRAVTTMAVLLLSMTACGGDGTPAAGADGGGGGGGPVIGPDGGALCAPADATAQATISGYMDKLPYANPTGMLRTQLIDVIYQSCAMFGPPSSIDAGWKPEYCWAHLVSAIEKESSYKPDASVTDSYGTRMIGGSKANDPVVGLLQIRFSSTVHDFAAGGPMDRLACVGCTFPASFAAHKTESGDSDFWAVSGPTQNLATSESPSCNIALAAWYYYTYATANGNPAKVTYLTDYCQGGGTGANLITGLRAHLEGPESARGIVPDAAALEGLKATDSSAYGYVTGIKALFDTMVTTSGTHPVFIPLSPDAPEYCGK
jgi:hypothetical protein